MTFCQCDRPASIADANRTEVDEASDSRADRTQRSEFYLCASVFICRNPCSLPAPQALPLRWLPRHRGLARAQRFCAIIVIMSEAFDGMAIARQRIAEEAKARTGFLDLGGLRLTELPPELFQLRHLRELNLGAGMVRADGSYHAAYPAWQRNADNNDIATKKLEELRGTPVPDWIVRLVYHAHRPDAARRPPRPAIPRLRRHPGRAT